MPATSGVFLIAFLAALQAACAGNAGRPVLLPYPETRRDDVVDNYHGHGPASGGSFKVLLIPVAGSIPHYLLSNHFCPLSYPAFSYP